MSEQKKMINFTVVCVNEFARKHNLEVKEAFQYLFQFKGIEFIEYHPFFRCPFPKIFYFYISQCSKFILNIEYDESMDKFYHSEVFDKLQNIETGLYMQSPAYVYDLIELDKIKSPGWTSLVFGNPSGRIFSTVSRYVDNFEKEEEIDLKALLSDMEQTEKEINRIQGEFVSLMRDLTSSDENINQSLISEFLINNVPWSL